MHTRSGSGSGRILRAVALSATVSVLSACAGDGPSKPAPATATPTATATASPTIAASPTSTNSPLPTVTGTRPPTPSPTLTGTPTASPSPTATETPAGPSFAEVQERVFDPTCLGSGCHNSRDRSGNLVLEEGASYEQIVGVTPDNPNAARAGLQRVFPGMPDQSFLVSKLEGPPRGQGSQMPLGLTPLSDEDIQLLRDWILAGAQP